MKELKTLGFKSAADFRAWLTKHHDRSEGIWLRIFKKAAGRKTVTYAEALDQALCFGWIDGQRKAFDEDSFIQKVTPRRPRSSWSKLNTQHVERLIAAGQMTAAGLKAVDSAKADGRWQSAYASQRNSSPPADFLEALERNKQAKAFFQTLNKANVYAIAYHLHTARKPETRGRRMKKFLAMMQRGEKFH